MKNLIYILVDALSFDNVGGRKYRVSPTPFLDELKKKSRTYDNMYTQAPYTEAAFVSTLCGENVLDNGGYLLGLQNCKATYADILKKRGYHTISTFSPYIMSDSYIRSVDEYFYSRTFSIQPLKLYRLGYYKERFEKGMMGVNEYKICELLLEDAFDVLFDQMEALINNAEKVTLIQKFFKDTEALKKLLETLHEQRDTYLENKKEYINSIFEKWKEHPLLKAAGLNINHKTTADTQQYIEKRYAELLEEIQKKYNKLMKKNLKYDWRYILDLALYDENKHHGAAQTYRRYKERYESTEIIDAAKGAVSEKVTVSAKRQLDVFANKIIETEKKGDNYFAFIHLEDFHLPSMIYTYDTDDRDVIDRDFAKIQRYVQEIPEDYRGNLLADMSALYVDSVLKEFFEKIKAGTEEDFVFVVTADHGYPCNYNPPRPIIYNAFYQENYHIPLIVYDSESESPEKMEGLYSSMDIMTLLLRKLENNKTELSSREYILIEYPGPGCPDISCKELYYAIYDGKYKIAFKARLDENITAKKAVLATDIEEDPNEKKNLLRKIEKTDRMKKLVDIVNKRHLEIRGKFGGSKFYEYILSRGE